METVTCIIADDEPAARALLKGYVQQIPYLQCVGDFSNALEAFTFLQHNRVSLVFLDIQMPHLNGLSLATMLPAQGSHAVVFTTAYADFALQGFETGAVDYIMKPVSFDRFLRAVTKALRYLDVKIPVTTPPAHADAFTIKVNGQLQTLKTGNITHLQSFGNFLKVFHDGKMTLVTNTVKQAEQQLQPLGFVRCHRSYLVNSRHVTAVQGDVLILSGGLSLPIGYLYKREVEAALKPGS